MARAGWSSLHIVHARTGDPAPEVMSESTVVASSRMLGWDGVVAEMGTSSDFAADDLAVPSHLVAINLGSKPLHVEEKSRHGFRELRTRPGALWINAANAPFTHRCREASRWGIIEVSLEKVRRSLGRDIEPHSARDIIDVGLAVAMRALLFEAATGGPTGPLFADGLAIAIAARLARHSGVDDRSIAPRGGISEDRLRRVKEAIEDLLAEAITTDRLAAIASLSPAHFSRAFKRDTGETPHGFVMRRRLERARELLARGRSISDAAILCGFSDQSHLSRLFKQRFSTTPGAFIQIVRGKGR